MVRTINRALLAASIIFAGAAAGHAADEPAADSFKIKPILDTRLRYENVDQPGRDADALTFRLRAGLVASNGPWSFLAEGEGTVAIIDDYNAFPFPTSDSQRRPQHSVVADPENLELNRLQVEYRKDGNAITLGRQRINLDDQRWVGSVGWRQNEQTFDAIRGEAKLGPVHADLTYAIDQRTIFGDDAGRRKSYDGDFVFAGLGAKAGPVSGKLFAYILDYDESFFLANSSQTFGILLNASFPVGEKAKLNLKASYARQSDMGKNPFDYAADYWAFEAGVAVSPVTVALGYEELGSDNGRAVQTPMATLHKFNGWADVFLSTPGAGLRDYYGRIAVKLDNVKALPGLNFGLAYHQFDSDVGGMNYGSEWDASLGFKIRKVGILFKYANYDADGFGVDTEKFWLQAGWSL